MARTVRGCCPLDCPDTCSWDIDVDDDGRPVALRGVREHPFTRGALCGKVNRYLDLVQRPGPPAAPDAARGRQGRGPLRADLVGRGTRPGGRRAEPGARRARRRVDPPLLVRRHHGARAGHGHERAASWPSLGTSQLDRTICTAAAKAALRSTVGTSVGPDPEDMVHARLIILWGANLLAANVHQWRFVLEARARGAHVVAIDPLRSETAERCDEHVAPLPGTDAALALGLMRVVVDLGAQDVDWLERHADGWPEPRAAARGVAGRARRGNLRPRRRDRAGARRAARADAARRSSASASDCSGTAGPAPRCAPSSPSAPSRGTGGTWAEAACR